MFHSINAHQMAHQKATTFIESTPFNGAADRRFCGHRIAARLQWRAIATRCATVAAAAAAALVICRASADRSPQLTHRPR